MTPFLYAAAILAVVMLLWDTIEVGRNDAANIVNAVFGSRILTREWAVRVAGAGVILGAYLSSDVIETARKGIFSPALFTVEQALAIYISVYLVDTILLYSYSAFGMPVSTTMTLVFELLGASLFLGALRDGEPVNAVKWAKAGTVMLAIICSIAMAGAMGFILQRAARGAIRDKWSSLPMLLQHGGWAGGGLMAGLCYFMMVKGGANVEAIAALKEFLKDTFAEYDALMSIITLWVFFAILIHFSLVIYGRRAARCLFPVLTVIGMLCMAFAFGQNDLANCASPGLAAIELIKGKLRGMDTAAATEVPIAWWMLLVCGALLVVGMTTVNARRVTRAEVRTGSAGDRVKLWAPQWCIGLATLILRTRREAPSLAPAITKTRGGRTMHYDPLRACVIVCVSACVIATASSLALPVSTTYVAFAAVVATGMADRIFVRGDAALKLGRAIWVVMSWFLAALIATLVTGVVCLVVYYTGVVGMVLCVAANLLVRRIVKRRADAQEERVRREAEERMHPEEFATEDE
ncbi:MAG: inorganic phosphate transporter [Phycisphaerae bacterium]|nr:inorganic phosphate transporter [Phycisphaerae bacterium]